jgi:hypothetical protein
VRARALNPLVAAAARQRVLDRQTQAQARALVQVQLLARDHRRRLPALDLQVLVQAQARADHRLQRDLPAAVTRVEPRHQHRPGPVALHPRPAEAEHPVQGTFRITVAVAAVLAVVLLDAPAHLVVAGAAAAATRPVSVAQPAVAVAVAAVEVVAAVAEDDDDETY